MDLAIWGEAMDSSVEIEMEIHRAIRLGWIVLDPGSLEFAPRYPQIAGACGKWCCILAVGFLLCAINSCLEISASRFNQ